jgi:large repetitive protein
VKRHISRAVHGFLVLLFVLLGVASGCSHKVESPDLTVSSLEPDLICNDQFPADGLLVKIHGDGFTPMPTQTLSGPATLVLPSVAFQRTALLDGTAASDPRLAISGSPDGANARHLGWVSSSLMTVKFDPELKPDPGLYSVTVTNPDETHSATLKTGLGVVPPPTITDTKVSFCSASVGGPLTLHGTNFVKFGDNQPKVIIKKSDGTVVSTCTASSVDGCTPISGLTEDVQICSSVTIDIPAYDPNQTSTDPNACNALAPGDYEVVVANPDSVGCTSTEKVPLMVQLDGPILFFSDPPVVFNGINTKITLYLTAVDPTAKVSIVPTGQAGPESELQSTPVPNKNNRLQATVPAGQAPGVYDIIVTDPGGCTTRLDKGLTVTDTVTITLKSVIPPFGPSADSTAVTVFRDTAAAAPANAQFAATPRGFLNPVNATAQDVAIQLESVTFVDGDTLTAVVPKDAPVKQYDLVVVNPNGEVGVLKNAYESLATNPPVITDVVPQSIVAQAGQSITVHGSGFNGATVSLRCVDTNGAPIADPPVTSGTETCNTPTDCTITATVDGSALAQGDVCVVRVTNADGSWDEFSAVGVTNSSFNLSQPKTAPAMNTGRRALGSVAVKATSASRFVYAIGGDGGSGTAALASVEFAPVDVFGKMSAWIDDREPMKGARSFLGAAGIGRYLYVFGGNDGSNALTSAERALVLSPAEVPHIEDLDLCLSGGKDFCFGVTGLADGLDAGGYSYRVSALIDPADPENLGGETLASDPIIMILPAISNRKISVKLTWSKPLDPLGAPLSGITGYRVYRVAKDGVPGKDEKVLADVTGADTLEFIDDGTKTPSGSGPLPTGSTSAWQALPNLATARNGSAAEAARDPGNPLISYIYALLGKDSAAATGGQALTSYEYLAVTTKANGRQSPAASWKAGAQNAAVGRWQLGAWVVDSIVSSAVTAPDTFIYLGGGHLANAQTDGAVEAGKVAAGGDLGAFNQTPSDFSLVRVGYGTAAAAGQLFCFGGDAPNPKDDATSATVTSPAPTLASGAWNNEGLKMTTARYLPGSSIQSAFIFLMGGETNNTGTVTNSAEVVVW